MNVTLNNTDRLKSTIISTDGGILLFYGLGVIVGVNWQFVQAKAVQFKNFLSIFNFLFFCLSVFVFLFINEILSSLIPNIRGDIYLLSGNYDYQRPGNFLTIIHIAYSFLFANFITMNLSHTSKVFKMLLLPSFGIIFIINMLISMYLAQVIGSNNALINLAGILFASITYFGLLYFTKVKHTLKKESSSRKILYMVRLP